MIAFQAALAAAQPEAPVSTSSWLAKTTTVFLSVMFVAICGLQLTLGSLYAGKIYPGVAVADQKVGGLSISAAQERLHARAAAYQVPLVIGGKKRTIEPDQVGVSYDSTLTAQTAFAKGREQWFVAMGMFEAQKNPTVPFVYAVDKTIEKRFVSSIVAEVGQAPVDAQVQVIDGIPQVIPDKNGYTLNGQDLIAAIDASFTTLNTGPVTMQPSTQPARIQAKDAASAIDRSKQLIAIPVNLTYADKTFTPGGADKGAWLTFAPTDSSGSAGITPTIDAGKVAAYIEKLVAPFVKIAPITHKVDVKNGVASEVQAGVDGLAVDTAALAQTIADSLSRTAPVVAVVPTKPVPFKTEYNRTVTLDYGRYIEINLSQQHLWVYQDHNVIYDSPVTSGATGAGFGTAQGLFSIQAKETNRHLIGTQYGPRYNYDVFVKYWMPFYQGYGLHDASWRNGNFGGQDYYYGGSHGCVNLPESTAAWLYNWGDIGTPVWVHT